MNWEAEEGQGFLMPFLPAVVNKELSFTFADRMHLWLVLFHYSPAVKSPWQAHALDAAVNML